MTGKFWPGLAVSALLGTAFCLLNPAPSVRVKPVRSAAAAAATTHGRAPAEIFSGVGLAPEAPVPLPRAAPPPPAEPLLPEPEPAVPPPLPEAPPEPPIPEPPAVTPFPAPWTPPAPRVKMQPSRRNGKTGKKSPMLPLRRMLMGSRAGRGGGAGTAGSNAALASLGSGNIDPGWDYYDLPDKGLEVWADAALFSEKQKQRGDGRTFYDQDGVVYSFGVKRDWSIDRVVGLSLDLLDSELESNHMLDYRKNDITGYRVNAHYEGVAFDRFAFEARGFYGRLDHEGRGYLSIHHQGNAWREDWREDKHRSDVYGFSAKIGMPLLWGPDVKVLPEFGVNYAKLRTDAYTYTLTSIPDGVRVPKTSSTSLEIPIGVTLRKDFLRCWGIVTPRLGLTYSLELDDGAAGVRAFNSSAASRVQYDPVANSVSRVAFDDGQKALFRVDLGLEVMSVGGWRLNAEYSHIFAEKYNNDVFRLELGRCF